MTNTDTPAPRILVIAETRRIDISTAPAPARALPQGWTPELMARVESGSISYRRAQHIAALEARPSLPVCPMHGASCPTWAAVSA